MYSDVSEELGVFSYGEEQTLGGDNYRELSQTSQKVAQTMSWSTASTRIMESNANSPLMRTVVRRPRRSPSPALEASTESDDVSLENIENRPIHSKNRRRSVVDEYQKLEMFLRGKIDTLQKLWNTIHMPEENRCMRVKTVFKTIEKWIEDMEDSERKAVESMLEKVRKYEEEVADLRRKLGMDPFEDQGLQKNSIAQCDALETEVGYLREEHTRMTREQTELFDELISVCGRLGEDAADIVPMSKNLISTYELEVLRRKLQALLDRLETRKAELHRLQDQMRTWVAQIADAGLEDDVDMKALLDADLEDEDFTFTQSLVEQYKDQHMHIQEIHSTWEQEERFKYEEQLVELRSLWDQCHVASDQRLFTDFNVERHNKEKLDQLEKEVRRMRAVYEVRASVYSAVDDWKSKWDQKVALEDRRAQPDYFHSRKGGNALQADLKLETRLRHELPRLAQAVQARYEEHTRLYPQDFITVDSLNPMQYIEWIQNEYHLIKKTKDEQKKAARDTPTKSKFNTPQTLKRKNLKTPASCSKLEPAVKKLNFDVSLFGETSHLPSLISPTRQRTPGPKCSSPKPSVFPRDMGPSGSMAVLPPKQPKRR